AEAYPDLKADEHFLALQKELSLTEDRIAASRRFYNGNVREMNQLRLQFPTSIVAKMFGFKEASFFELDSAAERVVPALNL
ncbi:MAG: LemA family protein, partial [Planctomycetota bacterium]